MFPFVLIIENTDDDTFERVTGTEQGRTRIGEKKKTIPAIQIETHRPERAVWGRRHPGTTVDTGFAFARLADLWAHWILVKLPT